MQTAPRGRNAKNSGEQGIGGDRRESGDDQPAKEEYRSAVSGHLLPQLSQMVGSCAFRSFMPIFAILTPSLFDPTYITLYS